MTKFKFWNEVCKYGAIIGLVMSVAFVIEQSLMLSGWFSTMGLVWILAAVVYIALLYRFAKRRREQYGHEQGFPLSRGLGFILALILVVGPDQGGGGIPLSQCFHRIFGVYRPIYFRIDPVRRGRKTSCVDGGRIRRNAENHTGGAGAFHSGYRMGFDLGNLIVGLVLGLILAGILARAPRPFGPQSEE